jgi:mannose-6-phosphate isomerase
MQMRPLRLIPQLHPRVWGGDLLARRFARCARTGGGIGESWEVHGDLLVAGGPDQGLTLDELARREGQALLGKRCPPSTTFPLLVKWLDCRDWLSVQVHPDDVVARSLTGDPSARGKTECWYLVEAEEGAEVIHGLAAGASVEDLARFQGRKILDFLHRQVAHADQILYTPAGTVHALGPGLLLLEIQQSSDLTYRLYDWGRLGLDGNPRELHLPEALRSLRDSRPEPLRNLPPSGVGQPRLACPHFALETITGSAGWNPAGLSLEILAMVRGEGQLEVEGQTERLLPGDVLIVPASAREVHLELPAGGLVVRVRLPEPS